MKNIGKFKSKKTQHSHRVAKEKNLEGIGKDQRKKKSISIEPGKKRNNEELKENKKESFHKHHSSKHLHEDLIDEKDCKRINKNSFDKEAVEIKRKREECKSTPRNKDFLPDFG